MRSQAPHVGARVRVCPDYRKPKLRGAVGTIKKLWGPPQYGAVEVRFEGGSTELLWRHEVEEIRKEAGQGAFVSLRWE